MAITLTPQDGSNPTSLANTYATLVEFKAYHDARLNDYADLAENGDDSLSAALVKAWQYMDLRWTYRGWRSISTQNTEFPRQGVFNDRGDLVMGIPQAAKDAQCEYAFRQLSADLDPDPTRDETGKAVSSRTEKVGPLEESVHFDRYSEREQPVYPVPDGILRRAGLIERNGSGGIYTMDSARG